MIKTTPLRPFCRDRCSPEERSAIDSVIAGLERAGATWDNWLAGWAHHGAATGEEIDRRDALMALADAALKRELAAVLADPTLIVTGVNVRAEHPERRPIAAPLFRRGEIDWLEGVLVTDRHQYDDLLVKVETAQSAPRQPKRAKKQERTGRKEAPEWGLIKEKVFEWLDENGIPNRGDGQQAALEKHIAGLLAIMRTSHAPSTVRRHAKRYMAECSKRPRKGR